MIQKPVHISVYRWDALTSQLKENINYLFVVQEILGHAFADYRGIASQMQISSDEFKEQVDTINKSLAWFSTWYSEAFKGNQARIEDLGSTGDELSARLKELYRNNQ